MQTPSMKDIRRIAMIGGGGLLALQGLRRGDAAGLAMAAAGSGLLTAALRGSEVLGKLRQGKAKEAMESRPVRSRCTMTISASRRDLYRFWRRTENLNKLIPRIEHVDSISDTRSHWSMSLPMGVTLEWESEVIDERENQLIRWRSVGTPDVNNSGQVRFRDIGDGRTEVDLSLRYEPPFGMAGQAVAWMMGHEPEQQAMEALKRLKQIMESGRDAHEGITTTGKAEDRGRTPPPPSTEGGGIVKGAGVKGTEEEKGHGVVTGVEMVGGQPVAARSIDPTSDQQSEIVRKNT
ncbi:SRPBCC family protein [Telmatospirillum sp. J64-1]|uniref:SRPBCC family protein n=1 Tax=Telmatospirillum sp. J64-1 TaxID=2502183 RepID=UPI00115E1C2C|nr:SRPBCC family protein [Telmatospirillum sp. J64-1]